MIIALTKCLDFSDLQSTVSTANLLVDNSNSQLHHRQRLASYSSSDDDEIIPTSGASNNTAGCGNGTGNCCSSTTTTPTTVVVDIEDLLGKRSRSNTNEKVTSSPSAENLEDE